MAHLFQQCAALLLRRCIDSDRGRANFAAAIGAGFPIHISKGSNQLFASHLFKALLLQIFYDDP